MQNQPKTTRFGLVRHGETMFNREKRIQGHGDSPLTENGKNRVAQWARVLETFCWDRILASDIGRAVQTAEIINARLKVPLILDARLREQNWGRWSGRTIFAIKQEEPELLAAQEKAGWDFCPPKGEPRRNVLQKSLRALEDAAGRWPGDSLLVVTHEGVIKCLVYHLLGRNFLPGEPAVIKPEHLHRLAHTTDGIQLEALNAANLSGS
jgi:probable phosphoglycerate mutase